MAWEAVGGVRVDPTVSRIRAMVGDLTAGVEDVFGDVGVPSQPSQQEKPLRERLRVSKAIRCNLVKTDMTSPQA